MSAALRETSRTRPFLENRKTKSTREDRSPLLSIPFIAPRVFAASGRADRDSAQRMRPGNAN